MKKLNENKDVRTKALQFYVSNREDQEIEKYSKIAGIKTKSKFIRTAIDEKILRMKNPDMFEKSAKLNGESKKIIHTILESLGENKESIGLLDRKVDLILDVQKNLEIISSRIKLDELQELDQALEKLLTENKILKLSEIAKKLGVSDDEVLKALSIKDLDGKPKYKMNFKTGGFEKND